jgi:hypothetical protein
MLSAVVSAVAVTRRLRVWFWTGRPSSVAASGLPSPSPLEAPPARPERSRPQTSSPPGPWAYRFLDV